ncbi:cytochrome P450 alkane hydroxylase [Aspergillus costaricaensis CBS 115574]|uniref:Cytochrome P450 alkane hydroxylase n=1 Tax=Aspergillus costaricaensis CBS 115574 TaxID=1448317 RepID=A0ACD1I6P1_9EURO|nr:cytochrome P450 alkane hydroxylase [Aspergillus costaricaensis CBS 115574]RAK86245.1 cytochrome P450 alkane hydroxylase [Aspergillus costaricaensis CBS 115574]
MLEYLVDQVSPMKASACLVGIFFLACLVPLDNVYGYVMANRRCEDLTHWQNLMETAHGTSTIDHVQTAELDFGISNRVIITKDPENIRALLTGQFADYGKGEPFHHDWKEFLGDSIFVTDGELWSRSRQLIRPMFTRDRIVDTELFEHHVQHLIPLLAGTKSNKVVDLTPLFLRYTLDAATAYLFGEGTNSLQNPATSFADAFSYVQHRQGEIFRYGPFNPILSRTKFRQKLRIMNEFMAPFIQRALSLSPEELDKSLSKQETFIHALARFTRDPQVIRDQLTAILLAGRDTTATTLAFCFFELSRNPSVVKALRSEIASRLGLGPSGRKPTYTDLKEMKYLTAVLNETMRVYPVVPFNVRYALKNTTLPRGGGPDGTGPVGVRANTRVMYSTMMMQRDPVLYPPPGSNKNYFDPGKWIPERWMGDWVPKPWYFVPFNGGPRICLGQQFAMIEMGFTVVRILQVYESLTAVPPAGKDKVEDPMLRFEITLNPGCELNCVFE